MKTSTAAAKFNAKYEYLMNCANDINSQLKKCLADVKKYRITSKAAALIDHGDRNCYEIGDHLTMKPIDGIFDLDMKMRDIEWIVDLEFQLKKLVEDYTTFVGKDAKKTK